MTLEIEKREDGDVTTYVLRGRLDSNTSLLLESEVKLEGLSEVAFDLSGLDYVSSAGLRVFLTAQKQLMGAGGCVTLISPNQSVRNVLDMTGLSDIFKIV